MTRASSSRCAMVPARTLLLNRQASSITSWISVVKPELPGFQDQVEFVFRERRIDPSSGWLGADEGGERLARRRCSAASRSGALAGGAAEALERFEEERLDVVRLQAARLGALHLLAHALPRGWRPSRRGRARVPRSDPARCGRSTPCSIDAREAGAHLGLVAVADGLDQQVAQRLALELQLAEHVEDLAAERLRAPPRASPAACDRRRPRASPRRPGSTGGRPRSGRCGGCGRSAARGGSGSTAGRSSPSGARAAG